MQFVVVLNSADAVKAFSKGGNVTLGGSLTAAAGPIGVGGAVNTSLINPAPMFTYSKSKGLFAGVSLEGTVLIERKDANADFYGQKIDAQSLLSYVPCLAYTLTFVADTSLAEERSLHQKQCDASSNKQE